MKRNVGKYALWVTLFLIAVVVFCLFIDLAFLLLVCKGKNEILCFIG